MQSEVVPQGYIVLGSNEIGEVKEYVHLIWIVNMCKDMDA